MLQNMHNNKYLTEYMFLLPHCNFEANKSYKPLRFTNLIYQKKKNDKA